MLLRAIFAIIAMLYAYALTNVDLLYLVSIENYRKSPTKKGGTLCIVDLRLIYLFHGAESEPAAFPPEPILSAIFSAVTR